LIITEKADKIAGCEYGKRVMSMQESYALGYGDCAEGALAFAALLSDNPEYTTKFITIKQNNELLKQESQENENISHLIVVYKKQNKFGMTSFNNKTKDYELIKKAKENNLIELFKGGEIYSDKRYSKGTFNFITGAKYDSLEELLIAFNNDTNIRGSIKHKEIFFPLEKIKFGK